MNEHADIDDSIHYLQSVIHQGGCHSNNKKNKKIRRNKLGEGSKETLQRLKRYYIMGYQKDLL